VTFLLDTKVVSEWVKPRPNAGVAAWTAEVDEDRVFLSIATLAELRDGIERLAHGKRRSRLDEWLREELPLRFEGRVLAIDGRVADQWGKLVANREAAGRPIGAMDAFLVATAATHSLTLVTRNPAVFTGLVSAVNPWSED
jgi:toxin FitB